MQQAFYWVSHHPSLIGWYDLKYLPSHILLQKHDFRTAAIGFKVLYVKVFLLVESSAVLYSCQHLQPTVAKYLTEMHADVQSSLLMMVEYPSHPASSLVGPLQKYEAHILFYFIFLCWKVTILIRLVTHSFNPRTETDRRIKNFWPTQENIGGSRQAWTIKGTPV